MMKNNAMPNEFENRLMLCKRPTLWLSLYVTILLMCWVIFGSLFSISYFIKALDSQTDTTIATGTFAISILIILLTLYTRKELLIFSKLGYTLNIILCWVIPFTKTINSIPILVLCFTIPNLIYFRKRKELFGFYEKIEMLSDNISLEEENTISTPYRTVQKHKSHYMLKLKNQTTARVKDIFYGGKSIMILTPIIVFVLLTSYFAIDSYNTQTEIKSSVAIIEQMKSVKSCRVELKNDTAFVYVKPYVSKTPSFEDRKYIDTVVRDKIKKVKYTELNIR